MIDSPDEFTLRLQAVAGNLEYPPTPDLVARVRHSKVPGATLHQPRRRPALALALALLIIMAALLAVPPVRAAVLEWIQIGVMRIFIDAPSSNDTPAPPSTRLPSWLKLAGQTDLAAAALDSGLPLLVPAAGSEPGSPDGVFYQTANGPLVLLTWSDPEDPEKILLSLLVLGPNTFSSKGSPETVQATSVRGRSALWLQGIHQLYLQTSETVMDEVQLSVSGNVLLWEEHGVTYRLESELSLAEVVQLAESLQPFTTP